MQPVDCYNTYWTKEMIVVGKIRSVIKMKSFKKCDISKAMEGTENGILFYQDIESSHEMFDSFLSNTESNEHFVDFEPN